tara:strand:- start:2075 stop:4471 length:2397 start_codon:yes stop_codon:yes gene_type:complete
MKIKLILNIILVYFFLFNSHLIAETIFFDSKNIKIEEDGNMVYATKGKARIPSKNIEIEGDKFVYDKSNSELIVFDNVKYIDIINDISIESNKLIYNEINNTVFSYRDTFIEIGKTYEIFSSDVLYNRILKEISSKEFTEVNDTNKNKFYFKKGLLFDVKNELISSKEVNVIDSSLNNYFFENSKVDLKINEIVGRDVRVEFEDSFFGDKNNNPLLKGRSVVSNDKNTKIQKAVFSTCNTENKKCRGWELQSKIFTHNKIKKLFEYEKSWFKVFDKNVFYLPYFNHPDPSVKRKSGFLTPFYRSSNNLGSSINIPYFYAISNSKDLTLNPRIYLDNEFILQSEYREAYENSNLLIDFSFNRDENTNTHLFAKLDGNFDERTDYELQVQNVTNDNYLKIHNIKEYTKIINSDSTLTSYFSFNREIDDNTSLSSKVKLYEDLSKNDNDKYQYIFPDFNFSRNIQLDDSYNGNFQFISSGFQKLYDTNKHEVLLKNDFNYESYDFINSKGFVSDYSLLLKNYNTYSKNSSVYEKNNDHEIFGTFLIKTSLPLKKQLENTNNYLKPIIQARFSPTNGKNISSSDTTIHYDNIFSSNRIGRSDVVEKGSSLTLGLEFEKQNLSNEKMAGFKLGNVLKYKKNSSLPAKTKLDQTRSDIVGNIFYKISDETEFSYNFSYDRDLDYSNYDSISAKIGKNKLVTTFNYLTENHDFGDSETISNDTRIDFTDEHLFRFNTTKNLKEDFTQFYKLFYEYRTDCLSASFQYEKKFFRDGSLVPDESLFFLIKFIPFAEIRGSGNTLFDQN